VCVVDEIRQRPRRRRGLFGGVKFGGMISEGSPIAGRCVQRESACDPCARPPGGAPFGNHPTSTHVPRPRKGRAAAPIDTARRAGTHRANPEKATPDVRYFDDRLKADNTTVHSLHSGQWHPASWSSLALLLSPSVMTHSPTGTHHCCSLNCCSSHC